MKGIILDIQRFSIHDGPGIRTTVFTKGCYLNCLWCHNPESKLGKIQLKYNENLCVKCKKCADVCKNKVHDFDNGTHLVNFFKCGSCFKCVDICNYQALSKYGYEISAKEVIDIVLKDWKYYQKSGGGLTISGGEALFQKDFSIEIAKLAKESGLHVVLETSGHVPKSSLLEIMPYVDLFLYDYKVTGSSSKVLIGANQDLILDNLKMLNTMKQEIVLRCPLINEYNLDENHLKSIVELVNKYNFIKSVEFLPYHNLGESKAKMIGQSYDISTKNRLKEETLDQIIDYISEKVNVKVLKC